MTTLEEMLGRRKTEGVVQYKTKRRIGIDLDVDWMASQLPIAVSYPSFDVLDYSSVYGTATFGVVTDKGLILAAAPEEVAAEAMQYAEVQEVPLPETERAWRDSIKRTRNRE